ncbi:hypothetical protein HOLleu_16148 [Holothuria leucospilota]|uniref:Uncharacterized protein n=1 Tax=Holothuria leucospilota TaxID=206669 RepID=A0A9Q1C5B5_HOLLE|nr:hypothetical protein HOLleu_16148 [Holothuria leucospilota]
MALVHYLTIILGSLMIYRGTFKLVPINLTETEGYDQVHKDFERFAKVFPLSVDPTLYCCLIGWVELVAGSVLVFGRQPYRALSALDILLVMLIALYTVAMTGETLALTCGVIFCAACALGIFFFRDALDEDARKNSGSVKSKST